MSHLAPFRMIEEAPGSRTRDVSRPVMLVGFLAQANLGLGYLASVLRAHGYSVQIVDFESDPRQIAEAAKAANPVLIGFSLIFQFYIERFQSLIGLLRAEGLVCHFTAGGHFPSLSYRETLERIPGLDSVVRFEGEVTLLELVDVLGTGREWRELRGIAYRHGDEVVSNPLRPLVDDLDSLPYPDRSTSPGMVLGHTVMPLLASRGCARTCSFCSIHMFYRSAPGKIVRTRNPAQVVREMRHLYDHAGATVFLFQDDDFPLYGAVWRRWAREFLSEFHRSGLVGRAVWKISCRPDAVDPGLFAEMRDAGLYFVYMGVESGTEQGLRTLHKQVTVHQNLQAVEVLKRLDLPFQFGFMLFEPSSTFETIRENLKFLHAVIDDGCLALAFCRMIPYDGTPIKDELQRAGRLKGDICHPGYDFLDPQVDRFYHSLTRDVDLSRWVHGYGSLAPQINLVWSEVAILERLFPPLDGMAQYRERLRALTAASNNVLFQVIDDTARAFAENVPNPWSKPLVDRECQRFMTELLEIRNSFMLRHQDRMLLALQQRTAGD